MSRPVWGAWIEISRCLAHCFVTVGRAPYGARGLKYVGVSQNIILLSSRAPYGARGLKLSY